MGEWNKGRENTNKEHVFSCMERLLDEKEVEIEKYPNWNLMEITLPKDGSYKLCVEYSYLREKTIGLFLTLLSICLIFLFNYFLK
jgi:hypothetical protein